MSLTPYKRNMKQDATYWPPGTPDGTGGVSFGTPTLVQCRWEDKAVLFRDANGQERTSEAVVYVNQEVATRGYLAQGDETASSDPLTVAGAREIRAVHNSPALRADKALNKAML